MAVPVSPGPGRDRMLARYDRFEGRPASVAVECRGFGRADNRTNAS